MFLRLKYFMKYFSYEIFQFLTSFFNILYRQIAYRTTKFLYKKIKRLCHHGSMMGKATMIVLCVTYASLESEKKHFALQSSNFILNA